MTNAEAITAEKYIYDNSNTINIEVNNNFSIVSAIFKIKAVDLEYFINSNYDDYRLLSVENLSLIYRHFQLAKALKLKN
ncbi:MAG: hypothetical protein IPK03_03250 [Bacteroidetes bacterium]|nr:hypothetical protein [Bacteroidota bacterium]